MNWSFDSIFFLVFGAVVFWLGISGSKWLFWGSTSHAKLEQRMGKGYKKTVNITCGILAITIGLYFLSNRR
jgi:hypothetical protein